VNDCRRHLVRVYMAQLSEGLKRTGRITAARRLWNRLHQLRGSDGEGVCQLHNVEQAYVAFAAFDGRLHNSGEGPQVLPTFPVRVCGPYVVQT